MYIYIYIYIQIYICVCVCVYVCVCDNFQTKETACNFFSPNLPKNGFMVQNPEN